MRPPTCARSPRDDDRTDAEPRRAAGAQQDISIAQPVAVGRDRDLGHFRITASGAHVERFDVVDVRRDADVADQAVHERVKRERVVRAGRESEVHRWAIHASSASCAATAASVKPPRPADRDR